MKKANRKAAVSLLAFCAPALLFYIVFMAYPMLSAFFYSLTDWNGIFQTYNILGLKNYIEALTVDVRFRHSLLYTMQYVAAIVVLENIFGLALALLVESRRKTKGLFRTILFMPNILSVYISSLVFSFIFSQVFPQLARDTFMKFFDQPWLGNPTVAFFSVMMVTLWHGVGYLMIIYIAALQGIPAELKEAAIIDGASPFQNFRHVSLPLLMPAVTVCLFLTLNSSFKTFDVVFQLTKGGPGYTTEVIALNIFNEGFMGNMRFGYATAKSIILFLIILVITVIQVNFTKKREVEL